MARVQMNPYRAIKINNKRYSGKTELRNTNGHTEAVWIGDVFVVPVSIVKKHLNSWSLVGTEPPTDVNEEPEAVVPSKVQHKLEQQKANTPSVNTPKRPDNQVQARTTKPKKPGRPKKLQPDEVTE